MRMGIREEFVLTWKIKNKNPKTVLLFEKNDMTCKTLMQLQTGMSFYCMQKQIFLVYINITIILY